VKFFMRANLPAKGLVVCSIPDQGALMSARAGDADPKK
jgi:hypothetical protein